MTGFRRILMATDFSPASEPALEEAMRLVRESGGTLLILHVYETPSGASVPYLPVSGYLDTLVAARTDAEARMEHLLARHALRSLDVRGLVKKGNPVSMISETAIDETADLIVMGTHGRRGPARFLLGSVASGVIARASCPVLTIRTPAASERAIASAS